MDSGQLHIRHLPPYVRSGPPVRAALIPARAAPSAPPPLHLQLKQCATLKTSTLPACTASSPACAAPTSMCGLGPRTCDPGPAAQNSLVRPPCTLDSTVHPPRQVKSITERTRTSCVRNSIVQQLQTTNKVFHANPTPQND
ncbi:hypothetical protein HYC85_030068 [Camellia sinensis]|uniref:Uncharacterized protein n=1 Tax=Camellia sinensis TaxID=4442 RepID=A0A7J7G0C6_CAMSI|nr:hypothetical protein HYC85_030068 [Camellia sinensis]